MHAPEGESPQRVSSSELKNGWHGYLERVRRGREEIVVTRYGRPIARLTPIEDSEEITGIFGILAGTVTVHGDIINPIGEAWEADA